MRGLELWRLNFALDDCFACYGLLGVFLVIWEWLNSLVVAEFGWVRWFECSIMLDCWSSLGLRGPVWNWDVLSNNGLV